MLPPTNLPDMRGARRPLVKLSDYALAKNYRDEGGFQGLTTEGDFGGSMGFLSPDHIRDFREVKEPADLYGAGAILHADALGAYGWGRRYAIVLFVRPIPRFLWPSKYDDAADFLGRPSIETRDIVASMSFGLRGRSATSPPILSEAPTTRPRATPPPAIIVE